VIQESYILNPVLGEPMHDIRLPPGREIFALLGYQATWIGT